MNKSIKELILSVFKSYKRSEVITPHIEANINTIERMLNIELDNTEDLFLLRSKFLIYCYSFHQYDMNKKRCVDEIESIIGTIRNNVGFTRGGISFEGSFDYLLRENNIKILKSSLDRLKRKQISKLSLAEFINYTFNDEVVEINNKSDFESFSVEELIKQIRRHNQMNIFTVYEEWCVQLFDISLCPNDINVSCEWEDSDKDLKRVLIRALEHTIE